MSISSVVDRAEVVEGEWITFPGGELEGKRPKALCARCRAEVQHRATTPRRVARPSFGRTLCFQCYRAGLERERGFRAAVAVDTASDARFQESLPFEPVNRVRLERLRMERVSLQTADRAGAGAFLHRGHQAQIAARRALQQFVAGLDEASAATPADRRRQVAAAIHAAELQLPDSWLPFVVSR